MPKLTVDGKEVIFEEGMTVLQAVEQAGQEVPVFCYHNRLEIAGNCRMCLVEVEGSRKPVASCAMAAGEGMVVHTKTPMVKKAREGVMEFLLINHPLDCPICDQGGECDLQDIAMSYGRGISRYDEPKRAVEQKHMGPLIKTHMTRCIHCTRCVRFLEDVAGVPEMGLVGRGENAEIVTYLDQAVTSEVSGNVLDLCPVGALTSRPYAFRGRPWELTKTPSIDVMDAVGSHIRLDSKGNEVFRILPRVNDDINEEWLSDKARFCMDGLRTQRLDRPYIKVKGKLQPTNWQGALGKAQELLSKTDPDKIGVLAGELVDTETFYTFRHMLDMMGVNHRDCRDPGQHLDHRFRAGYVFNTSIAGIEQADACLIIGGNPRFEAPLVNTRLRKRFLKGDFPIAYLGPEFTPGRDLTYPVQHLGERAKVLEDLLNEKGTFAKTLKKAKKPMLILSASSLKGQDAMKVLALVRQVAETYDLVREGWNGFNVLHNQASRVGGLDMAFVPKGKGYDTQGILTAAEKGKLDVLYLLGFDHPSLKDLPDSVKVIYQGHHGEAGASAADVILPGAAFSEKNATYVNTEGRIQQALAAIAPPGEAREDWRIVKELAGRLSLDLPFETIDELREGMALENPYYQYREVLHQNTWGQFGRKGLLAQDHILGFDEDYYKTNVIARSSLTLAQCAVAGGWEPEDAQQEVTHA